VNKDYKKNTLVVEEFNNLPVEPNKESGGRIPDIILYTLKIIPYMIIKNIEDQLKNRLNVQLMRTW
jgi:hypothetical protein